MTKPTGKKRGRPRKVPDFMARLGEDQDKWDKWLSSMGLPAHSSSQKEVLEHRLPDVLENGKLARPIVGNRLDDESLTQPSNSWFALFRKDDEDEPLPAAWLRYLEHMDVIAEARSPQDNGAELKKLLLEFARSRRRQVPPPYSRDVGTPAEFRAAIARNELEIRFESSGGKHAISILGKSNRTE
jgi:hypothetical protein